MKQLSPTVYFCKLTDLEIDKTALSFLPRERQGRISGSLRRQKDAQMYVSSMLCDCVLRQYGRSLSDVKRGAHAAVLFRQLLMGDAMEAGFVLSDDIPYPDIFRAEFEKEVGVVFEYGDWMPEPWFHVLVLVATGVVFYLLAIISMSRKAKKY